MNAWLEARRRHGPDVRVGRRGPRGDAPAGVLARRHRGGARPPGPPDRGRGARGEEVRGGASRGAREGREEPCAGRLRRHRGARLREGRVPDLDHGRPGPGPLGRLRLRIPLLAERGRGAAAAQPDRLERGAGARDARPEGGPRGPGLGAGARVRRGRCKRGRRDRQRGGGADGGDRAPPPGALRHPPAPGGGARVEPLRRREGPVGGPRRGDDRPRSTATAGPAWASSPGCSATATRRAPWRTRRSSCAPGRDRADEARAPRRFGGHCHARLGDRRRHARLGSSASPRPSRPSGGRASRTSSPPTRPSPRSTTRPCSPRRRGTPTARSAASWSPARRARSGRARAAPRAGSSRCPCATGGTSARTSGAWPSAADGRGRGGGRSTRGADYLVHAIGFTPGFPYLGGPPRARCARPGGTRRGRASPPARSPSAASQTGVYPVDSPGGWQLIGRTPMALFRRRERPAALLRPGDRVRFRAISPAGIRVMEVSVVRAGHADDGPGPGPPGAPCRGRAGRGAPPTRSPSGSPTCWSETPRTPRRSRSR